MDYERVVESFHESLYRFAYSLAGNKDDACELTQETYALLLAKENQIRDQTRVKSWLFTSLYRIYLGWKRREARLPHFEIASVEHELPAFTPEMADQFENEAVLQTLLELDEHHRIPLSLYYLENHSYREIAVLMEISIGTVMSRLSRAKALMRFALVSKSIGNDRKIILFK